MLNIVLKMQNDLKQIITHSCPDEDDVVVMQQQQQQWKHSRCLLAAVFTTLLATLSVTAVAVTLKILADSSAVKFNVQLTDDSLTEDISADANNNIVEYHVTDSTKHQHLWAISDFDRGVQLFKVVDETGNDVCYVTPLNGDETATPAEIINKPPTNSSQLETVVLYFDAMSAIKDSSVLGSKGQVLCASTKSFWIVPRCNSDSKTGVTERHDVTFIYVVTQRKNDVRARREASRGIRVVPVPVRPPPQSDVHLASANFRITGKYGRRRHSGGGGYGGGSGGGVVVYA